MVLTRKITPLTLLLALAVILRIPSLFEPYWYGDEGIYLTLGEGLRQGLVWYRDIYDNKPPLLYFLAAITGSVFWFRFLLLVWHALTVALFWKLAEALFAKNRRAVFLSSAFFTVLTTLPLLEGNIANAEIFMIGPTIAGMLLALGPQGTRRYLGAGIFFGAAALFKLPASLDFAAFLVFLGISSLGSRKLILGAARRAIILGIGFLIPVFLTIDFYWWKGALPDYLGAAFFQNLGYLATWGIPSLGQIQAGLNFRAVILALALTGVILAKKRFEKPTLFASIWLLFATFGMLLSGRPYAHYAIQAVPALALVLAILVFWGEKQRFLTLPSLFLFLGSLVLFKFDYYPTFSYYQNFASFALRQKSKEQYFAYFDQRVPRVYQIASLIASTTSPQERIFVWGTEPEIYALSRRLPPGKFVVAYHIPDQFSEAQTMTDLRERPPEYIIIIEAERPFPQLLSFVNENYIFVKTVNGAQVWKRFR